MFKRFIDSMSKDNLVLAANTSTGLAAGNTAFITFVQDNASFFSLAFTFLALIVTIVAHVYDKKIKHRASLAAIKKAETDEKRLALDTERLRLENEHKKAELELARLKLEKGDSE